MVVEIHVGVFWVVTQCNVVVEYQCFRGYCCFYLQNPEDLNMKHIILSENLHVKSPFMCLLSFKAAVSEHFCVKYINKYKESDN
jgi:hypothetical protein